MLLDVATWPGWLASALLALLLCRPTSSFPPQLAPVMDFGLHQPFGHVELP